MREGQKISFVYHDKIRFGIIHKIKNGVVTCWIPAECCYKSFRYDRMTDPHIIRGFWERLFSWF